MIKALQIRNYLLIEEIELEFQPGLTVITGETGAGKSLIIDSLELALGSRAEAGVIRRGSNKAEIYVTLDAEHQPIQDWLRERDLFDGSEAIVQRTIDRDRPSRAYINGRPTTLNSIRDLASRVIAVHGQSEHQSLQTTATQRHILDGYADILPAVQQLAELATEIRRLTGERASVEEKKTRLHEELSLLEHQYAELSQLAPQQGEFSTLRQDLLRATHASELATTLGAISHQLFYGDDATLSSDLSGFVHRLDRLTEMDDSLEQCSTLLSEAQLRIDDVARELYALAERTEYDPARIAAYEERMVALQRQARIHNVSADDLPETMDALQSNINRLKDHVDVVNDLDRRLNELQSNYQLTASEVSDSRRRAADRLADAVTRNIQNLGMKGGRFGVEFINQEADAFTNFGYENVRFVISTAPGQESGPLSAVASGGERSRLSLAIQVVAANLTQVPSLVFDEVDVGIGGKIAARVGHLLRTLGQSTQIFCITHLPQVAAKGNQQINVSKIQDPTSSVRIQQLDDQQRVMEIARMLSGAKITHRTTEHAKELLAQNLP